MLGLVTDALDKWNDLDRTFQTFHSHLELSSLDKNSGAYNTVRRYLLKSRDEAAQAKDDAKNRRAATLLIQMPV